MPGTSGRKDAPIEHAVTCTLEELYRVTARPRPPAAAPRAPAPGRAAGVEREPTGPARAAQGATKRLKISRSVMDGSGKSQRVQARRACLPCLHLTMRAQLHTPPCLAPLWVAHLHELQRVQEVGCVAAQKAR